MTGAAPQPDAEPEASRLPTLLWLSWRFLPPLDRADQRVLTSVASGCAYLAVPLTVGLAATRLPTVTLVSLLCLAVPALPVLWWGAVRLGGRRRETALALRQARINTRAAAAASISRLIFYPGVGGCVGAALISVLHRPLAHLLPHSAPLQAAIRAPAAHWLAAAPAAVALLIALTAVLGSVGSAACFALIRRLMTRTDRREAAPQPQ